jgi:hypothetical protein
MADHPPLPGTPVDLPIPPELAEALGYRGDARFVAFHYSACGDDAVVDDGRTCSTCGPWAFIAYRRHRAVAPLLAPFNLGYSDRDADHCIVLDREAGRASVGAIDEAREFLHARHRPPPVVSREQAEAMRRELEAMMEGWREQTVDAEDVARMMEEQRGRFGRMISFLDMCPTPPARGRG